MPKLDFSTQANQLINCPVVAYHNFTEEVEGDMFATSTAAKFEQDMTALLNDGYTPISLKQRYDCINERAEWPDKPFVCTMDDGYESNFTLAYPICKRLGVHTDIFIVTDTMGARPKDGVVGTPHFTWQEAKIMEDSGFATMQPHGKMHDNTAIMSPDELHEQVFGCIADIEEHLGKRAFTSYAFPGGHGPVYIYENFTLLHKWGIDQQCMNFWCVEPKYLPFNLIVRFVVGQDECILENLATYQQGLQERLL
ncbi:MAG: polysaccharide deacetylase family protein [Oscillospiraceae bacterium]|nr:polysaccharide deacetylase family protein [Oscillospiraceae bacterium]